MSLSAFTALCLGFVVETLVLWEQAAQEAPVRRSPLWRFGDGAVVSVQRFLIAVVFTVALALVGLFELTGWADYQVYMGQVIIDGIFVALGLFALYYGVLDPFLLPRINEQVVLSVHTTVMIGIILDAPRPLNAPVIVGLALVTLGLLGVSLTQRRLPALLKALLYLWYLISLLILTLQNDFSSLTEPASAPLPLSEAFVAGAAGLFLVLHGLFLVRFFLIASSLILPGNRRYIGLAMPKLFSDRQSPRWQALAVPAVVAGVVWLNTVLDLAPDAAVANVLILAIVQGIFAGGHRAAPDPAGL